MNWNCEFCETSLAVQIVADCHVCMSENCVELALMLLPSDSFADDFEFDFAEDYAD